MSLDVLLPFLRALGRKTGYLNDFDIAGR